MIPLDQFILQARTVLGRDLSAPQMAAQYEAVAHAGRDVLLLVAGPGSGKTTVLVLRALRHVFVDGILPESLLITTFTRKAAKELRTRWLDWGTALHAALESTVNLTHIDLNRCMIDTLDSVAHQIQVDFRASGTPPPAVADEAASNLIFKRFAFRQIYEQHMDVLNPLLARYSFEGTPPRNRGEALRIAKRQIERLVQDRVDVERYAANGRAESLLVDMLQSHRRRALTTQVFDFALIEEQFLLSLLSGRLAEWVTNLRAVLVDEYQDTNPLQEGIYLSLFSNPNVAATIVGDDDQAMYRFRGGSVELFTDFPRRCRSAVKRSVTRVDMVLNYRSTPEIVSYYNSYITTDPSFASARVDPPKPLVRPFRDSQNVHVLGMFRPDSQALAADLGDMLQRLVVNREVRLSDGRYTLTMSVGGALGDIVLLSHSIEESIYNRFGGEITPRFPAILRRELRQRGMGIFNPRGQSLRTIPDVGLLLGLLLVCVDPDNSVVPSTMPTTEARHFLDLWRSQAENYISSNPEPSSNGGLRRFVQAWQAVASGGTERAFPRDWPILELVFKLLTWLTAFQRDSEHQVWLEAITRVIAGAGVASPYGMQLLQNVSSSGGQVRRQVSRRPDGRLVDHVLESRRSFIRDALVPIAENEVDVDEDIMPSVPRDRLQLMTIHQAKGLEFPMVIVDVGSRYTRNHHGQRFLRFPDRPSNVVQAELDMEPFLPAPLRGSRNGLDRTFDDLVRLYYVAFSRAQSVLLLIGCESCLNHSKAPIPNVALGWRRDGSWPWRQLSSGRRPPVRVNPPFELV